MEVGLVNLLLAAVGMEVLSTTLVFWLVVSLVNRLTAGLVIGLVTWVEMSLITGLVGAIVVCI